MIYKNLMKIQFFMLVILFIFAGCLKQEPGEIEKETPKNSLECGQTNFEGHFLEHSNVLSLLSCLEWDKKFPHLNRQLKSISSESWNHLMMPINDEYFKNPQRRDKFFQAINQLDSNSKNSKTGLDNLAEIVSSLMKSNFYEVIHSLLKDIKTNQEYGITKEDIFNILSMLNFKKEFFDNLVYTLHSFFDGLENPQADISEYYRELIQKSKFKEVRKGFITNLLRTFQYDEISSTDREIIPLFPTMGSVLGSEPFLYKIIQDEQFSYLNFFDLMNFSVGHYPDLIKDNILLREYIEKDVSCEIQNSSLYFNLNREFLDFVDNIVSSGQADFFDYLIDRRLLTLIDQSSCEWSKNKNLNILNIFDKVTNLIKDEPNFNLVQYIHSVGLNFTDEKFPFYVSDFLKGKFNFWLIKLMKEVLPKVSYIGPSRGDNDLRLNSIVKPIFSLLKTMNADSYLALGNILSYLLEENQIKKIGSLSKIWSYFGNHSWDVQDFLLGIVDDHYADDIQYNALFKFYQSFTSDLSIVLPSIANSLTSDRNKLEKTFKAISEISEKFEGEDVLNDLRRLYSRDYIIAIIGLISANVQSNYDFDKKLSSPVLDEIKLKLGQKNSQLYIFKPDSKVIVDKKIFSCMEKLQKQGGDLYYLIKEFPNECKNITSGHFGLDLINYFASIEKDFYDHTKQKNILFDNNGLLSPQMLKWSMLMSVVLRDSVKDENNLKNGIEFSLETLKEHLFQLQRKDGEGYIEEIESLVLFTSEIIKQNIPEQEKLENSIISYLANLSDEKIKSFANNLSIILDDYSKFNPTKRNYVFNSKCSHLRDQYNADPCPSKSKIKYGLKRLIYLLARTNEGEPRSLLRMFLDGADYRVGANLRGRKDPFYMSVRNWFDFMYVQGLDRPGYIKSFDYIYTNEKDSRGNYKKEVLYGNIGDRFELLLRDIQFNKNQLAAYWQNDLADTKSRHFKSALNTNLNLFNFCISINMCGKILTNFTKAKAKNVVETYPSVVELTGNFNFGKLGKSLSFKDHIHFLTNAVYQSSAEDSKSQNWLIMMNDKELAAHNGQFYGAISNLSGIRNVSRWIKDRFGKGGISGYAKSVSSYNIKRVDKLLLSGMKSDVLAMKLERFIQDHTGIKDNLLNEMIDYFVDWAADLSDHELGEFETLMGNLLLLGTYIGAEDIDPGSEYVNLTSEKLINQLDLLIQLFPVLSKKWNIKVVDLFGPLNNFVEFLVKGLDPQSPNRIAYFEFLNQSYKFLDNIFLTPPSDQSSHKHLVALNLLVESFKKSTNYLSDLIGSSYEYLKRLHQKVENGIFVEDKGRFRLLGRNLKNLTSNPSFSLLGLKSYLKLTTLKETQSGPNPHYGEAFRLAEYLSSTKNGKTRFRLMGEKLFLSGSDGDYDSFKKFLLDIFHPEKMKIAPSSKGINTELIQLENPYF